MKEMGRKSDSVRGHTSPPWRPIISVFAAGNGNGDEVAAPHRGATWSSSVPAGSRGLAGHPEPGLHTESLCIEKDN